MSEDMAPYCSARVAPIPAYFLIHLGVSLTHVVNYVIQCIIFIYYFCILHTYILHCTVIFCLLPLHG